MRSCISFLLFSLVYTLPVAAQCDFSPWLSVWPDEQQEVIQPRQVFLFSASTLSLSYSELERLGRTTEVYLWSTQDSVSLQLQEQSVGIGDKQRLFRPMRPLQPLLIYELRARNESDNKFYIFRQRQHQPGQRPASAYRWRVSDTIDTVPPHWTATPAVVRREYSENSEGVNNYVQFSYPVQDASPVLVRATIRTARLAAPVVSYLIPWQNQLGIGWFTCGGNFIFGPNEACNVTFEALDAAGNRSSASGRPIQFRGPARP